MAKTYPSPQSCNFERGRAGSDGEYAAGDGDKSARYSFSIAMTNADRDGNQTDPDFYNFTAWGWVADALNERGGIKKGQKLTVLHARIKTYKDREGNTRVGFNVNSPDDVLTPVGVSAPKLQSREAPVEETPRRTERVEAGAKRVVAPRSVPSAIDNDEDLPF